MITQIFTNLLVSKNVREVYRIHPILRVKDLPVEVLDREERRAILFAIDNQWQEHLERMEELREGIFLRSQGQKDPLAEYKNESYVLFNGLMESIHGEALGNLFQSASGLGKFLRQVRNTISK